MLFHTLPKAENHIIYIQLSKEKGIVYMGKRKENLYLHKEI